MQNLDLCRKLLQFTVNSGLKGLLYAVKYIGTVGKCDLF